jgi:hypothetical protein
VQIVRFDTLPARPTPLVEDYAGGSLDPSVVALLTQLGGVGAVTKVKP